MKKLLLSLFVWFVWIISFCNAISFQNSFYCPANWYCDAKFNIENIWDLKITTTYSNNTYKVYYYSSMYWSIENANITIWDFDSSLWVKHYVSRARENDYFVYVQLTNPCWWSSCTVNYTYIISWWTCPDCPTCDDPYTSMECQTEYNLIPVDDVDINYCVWNWLCPNECGSWTDFSWDLQYSNIYINSILHPWEENIFINIPDYIQWDYSVTTWEFNVYVWSWYDMDYMNSIIKINSYRPDSTDFTNIFVSGLTLIFPYIFVLLLIVFIWKLIKRVFK